MSASLSHGRSWALSKGSYPCIGSMSVLLWGLSSGMAAKHLSGAAVSVHGNPRTGAHHGCPVHDYELEAFGLVGDEALASRRHVGDAPDRSGVEAIPIEDDDIRRRARTQVATVEFQQIGELTRELAHTGGEVEHAAVAHPAGQEVRRHHRVTDGTDVGAGVRGPEHAAVCGEQRSHAVFDVIAEHNGESHGHV